MTPGACGRNGSFRAGIARSVAAAAALAVLALVPAVAAKAAGTPVWDAFVHCPVGDKKVMLCMSSTVGSGEFKIKSTTLSITAPITMSMGLYSKPTTGRLVVVPPSDGTPLLQAEPIPVSILGIDGIVYATPSLLSLPTINLQDMINETGPAVTLPLEVVLSGPGLGSDCTIGDAANPIVVNLTDGTTDPPPPNTPISGSLGTLSPSNDNNVIHITGTSLVDNAFAVPGAYNCGPLGALDPVLDLYQGLPSAAGNNTAVMNANSLLATSSWVAEELSKHGS